MVNSLNDGMGRNQNMVMGSESVRQPEFRTRQQASTGLRPYQRTSLFDNLKPVANGLSRQDAQNQAFGNATQGASEGTIDQSIWLRNPATAGLYQAQGI